MSGIARAGARVCAALGLLLIGLVGAHAAGAMAVGSCAAYGYAYDYKMLPDARAAALKKCSGRQCRLVASMQHTCGAFAIDGHDACGPHGYAVAPLLGQAQNLALKYCYKYGGRDCVIRAFACDGKG
jgi:hypothetical protein